MAVLVKTVSYGTLTTLAWEKCRFYAYVDSQHITLIFLDCLYAPDILINLFLIGFIVEHGIDVHFIKNTIFIFSPSSSLTLQHKAISASTHNWLSFLYCNFIFPNSSHPVSVLAIVNIPLSVPWIPATPDLWHCNLGHPLHKAPQAVLTKYFASEVDYVGSFFNDHCIPCIVGKQPAQPFDHYQHHVDKVCDLFHINSCSPFSTQFANSHTNYFHSILDNFSNLGGTALLFAHFQANQYLKTVQAHFKLKSDNEVKVVRYKSAKEFVTGILWDNFDSTDIILQFMASYAHQQNRKAERYICTIKDNTQAMIAESGLSMLLLSNAIITVQYLCNCLPSSTFPALNTSYKIVKGTKPDLSHLHVWDCQCFVLHLLEMQKKWYLLFWSYFCWIWRKLIKLACSWLK